MTGRSSGAQLRGCNLLGRRALWLLATAGLVAGGCGKPPGAGLRGRKPGEQLILNVAGENLTFCWIPPGRATLGSPPAEPAREADESQLEVRVRDGFWLAAGECSQALWVKVMGTRPAAFAGDPRLPVENVSWNDCQSFLAKIQAELPDPHWCFRLPRENEWEYACRAGSPAAFYDRVDAIAWTALNAGGKTHPAARLLPNSWGLFDMHGNVAEWCDDCYANRPATGRAAKRPAPVPANFRVIRGGSWATTWDCRAAARNCDCPALRMDSLGFRIALAPRTP